MTEAKKGTLIKRKTMWLRITTGSQKRASINRGQSWRVKSVNETARQSSARMELHQSLPSTMALDHCKRTASLQRSKTSPRARPPKRRSALKRNRGRSRARKAVRDRLMITPEIQRCFLLTIRSRQENRASHLRQSMCTERRLRNHEVFPTVRLLLGAARRSAGHNALSGCHVARTHAPLDHRTGNVTS